MTQKKKPGAKSGHPAGSHRTSAKGVRPKAHAEAPPHPRPPVKPRPAPHVEVMKPPLTEPSEYRLLVAPHFNEREQKYTTLVALETTKSFASFRYELSVREWVEGNTLRYKILGLKAPQLSLPASGRAQFAHEYNNLNGHYEVAVEGLDGNLETFSLRISPQRVKVLKAPDNGFVDIVIDESLWSEL